MVHTNFHGSEVPKEGLHCVCLSVTTIDFIMKINGKYYPHVFLEECKYVKKSMVTNFIDAKLDLDSSDDFDGSDSE